MFVVMRSSRRDLWHRGDTQASFDISIPPRMGPTWVSRSSTGSKRNA